MRVALSQLHEGDNLLHFQNDRDKWLVELQSRLGREGAPTEGVFAFDAKITKLEPDFVLQGDVRFTAKATCFRCADSFLSPVHHVFTVGLAAAPTTRSLSEANLELEAAQNADISLFVGHEIDIGDVLEEQCLLALPYRQLCQEECKGVCQQCGTNWNREECGCAQGNPLSPFLVLGKLKGK